MVLLEQFVLRYLLTWIITEFTAQTVGARLTKFNIHLFVEH